MFEWEITSNNGSSGTVYQCWCQTRELRVGEPMHSGVRQYDTEVYRSIEEAEERKNLLNKER